MCIQICIASSASKSFLLCSSTETLDADDKFFCDVCQCLQEAQKRMKIKQLPQVLCLHLKRFKYIEQHDRCARQPQMYSIAVCCSTATF